MKIKPLFDKVVIEPIEAEERTKSGIILPTAAQEKQQLAKIIAVGPGGTVDGKEIEMQVKEGMKILYSKFSGNDFKIDGKEVTIIRQSDILAIVE
ncbi:MAG: co-chaperone GroES [Clostridia bacterium]|jgi:chaperonin GroES|nr:co-chaperone GroES [Clostridia bacterium]